MSPSVDPAILEALGLDASQTNISTHGSSGFASSFKISTTVDGQPMNYFVKTGSGKDSEVMFRGAPSNSKFATPKSLIHLRRACLPQRHTQRCPKPLPQIPRPRDHVLLRKILPCN